MKEQDDLITLDEARKILGVSRGKLGKLIDSGDLPHTTTKLDKRKKLVKREDVQRLKNS